MISAEDAPWNWKSLLKSISLFLKVLIYLAVYLGFSELFIEKSSLKKEVCDKNEFLGNIIRSLIYINLSFLVLELSN